MSLLHDLANLFQHHAQQSSQQPDNGLVAGHQPMPGYHDQAVQYEQAMQSGNMDSPVAHMDPKYFGYPADNTVRPMNGIQVVQAQGGMQQPSWNNGQGTLNGQFNQGSQAGPEYTASPYSDVNRRRLY